MAASDSEGSGGGVELRSREESQSFRARVQFRKSHSGPPKMEGYLRKRTAKLNLKWFWRKYWFVLDGRSLLYFKSQSNYNSLGTCKGLVDFGLVQAVRPSHGSKNNYTMEVITRSDVIHLAADDSQTRQVWVAALQAAIQVNEVSWPFKVQLDNAPTLVQMQRGEICNKTSTADSEARRSKHSERRQKTSSLIIYESVSLENIIQNVSSERRPSSEGAIYQQISEAQLKTDDCKTGAADVNHVSGRHSSSPVKKERAYSGMLRRARSFSVGLMTSRGRLPGFHKHRDKSCKIHGSEPPRAKQDPISGSPQTPGSSPAIRGAKGTSHQKQDSIGSGRSVEASPGQAGGFPKKLSHQKQGSTGSAKSVSDTSSKSRFQLGSSRTNRVQENRLTASLDVNPTYQTAAETGVGFATEPSRGRTTPSRQNSFAPDSPPKSPPSMKPRSELDGIPIPSREYAEIYEDHVPPSLVQRAGDGYQKSEQHCLSDEVMIPDREYAEIYPSRQNSSAPDSPPKPLPNMKPRSELDGIPIPSREYAEIYEDHVPPSLVERAGDGYQKSEQHCPSDEIMIPNREYAEIYEDHVPPPFKRTPAMAVHMRADFEHVQSPSWEYAEISESSPSLTRTFSVPPSPGTGVVPLGVRRPSNPECTWQRKISKESTDDSSLHIYQEVQGMSRSPSPSPRPSPRTVFLESQASSTGPVEMDEEECYYSSISEEDLRRYHWCTDLEQVGETSETGTGSTYNTAANASCEALAETGYMEDNPHITVAATNSAASSRSSSGGGVRVQAAAPSSEAMRELRELLDCLGTESDGNVLTGERSIAKARQLLVREMGHTPVNEA
ncbi:uncharacterized protein LOC144137922 isoform X2 [Haemaphysalis longicornis]